MTRPFFNLRRVIANQRRRAHRKIVNGRKYPTKKTNRKEVLPTLPSDLLLERILPRLPTKSLQRFKSVCKLWESQISHSKRFIEQHRYQRRNHTTSVIYAGNRNARIQFFDAAFQCIPELNYLVENFQNIHCTMLLAGLICVNRVLSNEEELFRIVNPWTRKTFDLPAISIDRHAFCHFVRDPVSPSPCYKLLVLHTRDSHVEALIFTLGVDSSWRNMGTCQEFAIPEGVADASVRFSNQCVLHGALHWLPETFSRRSMQSWYSERIIAFDIGKEKFRTISCPEIPQRANDYWVGDFRQPRDINVSISIVDEQMHLLYFDGDNWCTIDVWLLKDYEEQVWEECYSFSCEWLPGNLFYDPFDVVGFSHGNAVSWVGFFPGRMKSARLFTAVSSSHDDDDEDDDATWLEDDALLELVNWHPWTPIEESLLWWDVDDSAT